LSQIGDLLARILSAGGTRGLSRDAELVLAPQSVLAFFNESLRRHVVEGDVVADPGLLWDTGAIIGRRGGLRAHLAADRGSGVLGVSDILVIVNRDDWRRSFREVRVPWVERAGAMMNERFGVFCRNEDYHLAFPQRPLGFRIVEDGGAEMRGERIGLSAGEFVTGLLPNMYGGPLSTSRRSIALHLHIPGAWESYQEIGALYSDQILFTLGSHWLDNFRHPKLEVPALYRLHQYGDGSFVHVINPEVMGRYRITGETRDAGPQVLQLERDDGEMLAWMVLQVVEEEGPPLSLPPRRWSNTMDELGSVPADGNSPAEIPAGSPVLSPAITSSRTVVPDAVADRLFVLRETGALLQKVHFARFMEGYDVFIAEDGRVGTAITDPAATLHVRGSQVSFEAHTQGVSIGGASQPAGAPIFLSGDARIAVGETVLEWRDLSDTDLAGWPYLGELRRQGSTSHLVYGVNHRVGREPRCAVRLPDEPHNDNIVWRPELRVGGTIRSRNGEIPKSRFYIDSIMVASEHAELDLNGAPQLRSLARDCYTYIRRDGQILPLSPRRKSGGPIERTLRSGDEMLVGNCVFRVSWGEPDQAGQAAPSPLTARELAAAADMDVTGSALPGAGPGLGAPTPRPTVQPPAFAEPVVPAVRPRGVTAAPPTPVMATPDPAPQHAGSDSSGTGVGDIAPAPVAASVSPASVSPASVSPASVSPASVSPASVSPASPVAIDLPQPTPRPPSGPFDLPAAAGLGERGHAPPPLALSNLHAQDSMLGVEAPDPSADLAVDAPTRPAVPRAVVADMLLDAPTRPSVPKTDVLDAPTTPQAPTPRIAAPMLLDEGGDYESESDPTAVPMGAPPPIEIEASGDSILGVRDPPQPGPVVAGRASLEVRGGAMASGVSIVDEADWQHELSRPARLALVGWMVTGTVVIGNHGGADIVIPENRSEPQQRFSTVDYAELYVRGRRGRFKRLSGGEARVRLAGQDVEEGSVLSDLEIEVIRRDAIGEEDFVVGLSLGDDATLPDPRARLLSLDRSDRMAAALFTLGMPRRQPRTVQLGPIAAKATWDGEELCLEGYAHSYRRPGGGWRPFFVRTGDSPFRTVAEDGAPLRLRPGDKLISGNSVYVFEGLG
jgi:hypothetical protein